MSQNVLAQLSVQEFFQGYNWLGQPPKLKPLSQATIDPTSWLTLNLEDFLSQNNWKGSPTIVQSSSLQLEKVLSLTLTVQEYFQFKIWQGTPSVTAVPKIAALPESRTKASEKFQVTDLSNLF